MLRRNIGPVMSMRVAAISRYPVKGLSGEALDEVVLAPGGALPGDRRFALARGAADIDPAAPKWAPKTAFLNLASHPRLAKLATRFNAAGAAGAGIDMLTISRRGREVARGDVASAAGRAVIEDFFAAFMRDEALGAPRLLDAAAGPSPFAFTDVAEPLVSIINLASVRDLERVVGRAVDPARFRGNVLVDGLAPWAEFGWLGGAARIGEARLRVTQRIQRCAATSVDPGAGERDINVPQALRRGFGRIDMGVYATVRTGGRLAVGDAVEAPA